MKRLFYILLFSILTLSGFAQKEKGLMSRLRLRFEPMYILQESDVDKLKFYAKAPYCIVLTENVNPDKVYRLFIKDNTFPIVKYSFPNLQQLIISNCFIPKDLSQFKKLQYLRIGSIGIEGCCKFDSTFGFYDPPTFPEEIYNLQHLKKISYGIDEHYGHCSGDYHIHLSERLFNKKKIKRIGFYFNDNYARNSLHEVCWISDYFHDPIFNLLQDNINRGCGTYKRNFIKKFHKNGSFSKKNKSGIVIHGNFYKNKAEGEWRIEFPTGCRSTFWECDSLPEDDAYTEVRYYKNGLEDSVWSIINAQGDTLRRDYFSNGVWKKKEIICYNNNNILSGKCVIENLYDYPNRIETQEDSIYVHSILKEYYKNGEIVKITNSFNDATRMGEYYYIKYTKDSSYSICKTLYFKDSTTEISEEIKYTNGSAHYKYYTPIDQISRYDVVAPKNNLTTTEEFFKPEYIRIEYNQDRNKKYLFNRTYYNKQGAILNQDTVNITDRGLINTTYYLDTIDTQKRILDSYWSPGYYRFIYKNIKGETIYTKTNTDDDYPKTFFDRTIEEEFFQPEYVKIKYYKDKQNTNIIHRYYYNKSEKIIKQDTINPNDYDKLPYKQYTPTEHNK